ncbi:MAG: NAD-binding protein [Candidatus Limnocylindrales bacterium]
MKRITGHPMLRRLSWYTGRIREQLNARFVVVMFEVIGVVVLIAALLVAIFEKKDLTKFPQAMYWAFTTILGAGQADFVESAPGWLIRIALVIFAIFLGAVITATVVAVIIDFLLKEGQGLGASGFRDHVVLCGWNSTARGLVEELRSDDYRLRVVLIHDSDRNPAGEGVYFVRGDSTSTDDLERAGIREAQAALIFPASENDDADMRSILTTMAIESVAPSVRTVAEVNNPRNVQHFMRAHVDEVLVTSKLASHLLARTALYPGLSSLVTDIVSGGEGSELYRVALPAEYIGLSVDEVSARLRRDHRGTLLAITRGASTYVNPPAAFVLEPGDDALVVAQSLGTLAPLVIQRHRRFTETPAKAAAVAPASRPAPDRPTA